MFLTTATGRCSIAPAEALTTAGVTRAALCAGTTTPVAPLATLRGQAGARRSARESLRDELEAVGDVADLPALLLDRAAEPICLVEVPACPGLAPLLREGDKIRRRRGRFGKAAQPEQRQSPK